MQEPEERSHPEPETRPAYQLWRAHNAWQRVIRKALIPVGITHAQFLLLGSLLYLNTKSECVTQRQLARHSAMDENMASQVVRGLVSKGLLERNPHPTDRRAQCLTLTEEGLRLTNEGIRLARPASQAFFAPLDHRAGELAEMLRVLLENQPHE